MRLETRRANPKSRDRAPSADGWIPDPPERASASRRREKPHPSAPSLFLPPSSLSTQFPEPKECGTATSPSRASSATTAALSDETKASPGDHILDLESSPDGAELPSWEEIIAEESEEAKLKAERKALQAETEAKLRALADRRSATSSGRKPARGGAKPSSRGSPSGPARATSAYESTKRSTSKWWRTSSGAGGSSSRSW